MDALPGDVGCGMTYNRAHNIRVMQEYGVAEVPIYELQVAGDCRICFRGRERIVPEGEIRLLSPQGIVHEARDERTACGHDATGLGWWWRV